MHESLLEMIEHILEIPIQEKMMCHVKDSISGQRTRDDFPWPKKTPTGSWKITCETRRLHNFCLVWISFNGMRALIFSDSPYLCQYLSVER